MPRRCGHVVTSSNLAGAARHRYFPLFYWIILRVASAPIWAPMGAALWGGGFSASYKGPFTIALCIGCLASIHAWRLTSDQAPAAFTSTTVRQRVSPANTHNEMLASLDCFNAERFCRQQDLAQLVTLLGLERRDVDLVRWLDLKRAAFSTECSSFTVSLFHPVAARLRFRSPSITICVLPALPLAMARARSSHQSWDLCRPS